jgi:hypothetical protein
VGAAQDVLAAVAGDAAAAGFLLAAMRPAVSDSAPAASLPGAAAPARNPGGTGAQQGVCDGPGQQGAQPGAHGGARIGALGGGTEQLRAHGERVAGACDGREPPAGGGAPEERSERHASQPGRQRGGRRGWMDERGGGAPGRGGDGSYGEAERDMYSAERREAARLTRRWRSAAKRAAAAFAGARIAVGAVGAVGALRCSVRAGQVMQGCSLEVSVSCMHAPAVAAGPG